MIYCKDCYIALFGEEDIPVTFGRGWCDECGVQSPECFDVVEREDETE